MKSSKSDSPSRRTFLKTAGIAVAAAGVASRAQAAASETLAVDGGTKAVSIPSDQVSAATKWPRFTSAEKDAVVEAMDLDGSGVYGIAPQLENEWKAYHNVPFVKTHMNGTSALTAMFFGMDLPEGSEVMVPSYTFFATIAPMRFFGLVPIFVDINPRTACFDLADAARKLTPNTRAMVPMHAWGLMCDMDEICAFGKEHGLIICEDAAHAHGASLQDKKSGAWGDMSIFSLQATKPLPAIEGGIGMYQTREHFERSAVFGHYELPPKLAEDSPYRAYAGTGFGQKFRMHPLSAAIARKQLAALDDTNANINRRVRELNDQLVELPGFSEPFCRKDQKRVYYNNNLFFLDEAKAGFSRSQLIKALQAEGVSAGSGSYPEQHKFKLYSEEKWWHHKPTLPDKLAGTDEVNKSCIYLPLLHDDVPGFAAQYADAFKKVWANKDKVAQISA